MSLYAVVLDVIRRNPGLTPAQIAAKVGPGGAYKDTAAVDREILRLKDNLQVAQTGGTFATATFAVTDKVE